MFYSQIILARKGPLGKIWLAAHYDKKLTKTQIFSTDISKVVESVLNPTHPLALRVSGHLMLGIVRIYSRKVKYLMSDCTEAMWKIKLAFRSSNADAEVNLNGNMNVDDPKYFGQLDNSEFPELQNTSFPQFLLANYDNSKSASKRSFRDVDDSNSLELRIPGGKAVSRDLLESPSISSDTSIRKESHRLSAGAYFSQNISDIELVRANSSQSNYSIHSHLRPSFSSHLAGSLAESGSRPSMSSRIEEEVPAFDEDQFENENNPSKKLFHNFFEGPQQRISELVEFPDEMNNDSKVEENKSAEDPVSMNLQRLNRESLGDKMEKNDGIDKKSRVKRSRQLLDEVVELSERLIKQRISNVEPILRRRPSDGLIETTATHLFVDNRDLINEEIFPFNLFSRTKSQLPVERRVAQPIHLTGLCPELQNILNIATIGRLDDRIPSDPFSLSLIDTDPMKSPPAITIKKGVDDMETVRRHDEFPGSSMRTSLQIPLSHEHGGSVHDQSRFSGILLQSEDDPIPLDPSRRINLFGDEKLERLIDFNEEIEIHATSDALFNSQYPISPTTNQPGSVGMESSISNRLSGSIGSNDNQSNSTKKTKLLKKLIPQAMNDVSEKLSANLSALRNNPTESNRTNPVTSSDWSLRTRKVNEILDEQFHSKSEISFNNLTTGVSKSIAAGCFLEILQLKTWGKIQVAQSSPFEDITIRKTEIL